MIIPSEMGHLEIPINLLVQEKQQLVKVGFKPGTSRSRVKRSAVALSRLTRRGDDMCITTDSPAVRSSQLAQNNPSQAMVLEENYYNPRVPSCVRSGVRSRDHYFSIPSAQVPAWQWAPTSRTIRSKPSKDVAKNLFN